MILGMRPLNFRLAKRIYVIPGILSEKNVFWAISLFLQGLYNLRGGKKTKSAPQLTPFSPKFQES